MFDKKKLNFWRLALGFAGLTLITLMFLWTGPLSPKAQMMDGSMGKMMAEMHAGNLTIYDFFIDIAPEEHEEHEEHEAQEAENHHEDASSMMRRMNFWTTATVFLLLPLILGGAIVLTIVWFK